MFDTVREPLSTNAKRGVFAVCAAAFVVGAVWAYPDGEAVGQDQGQGRTATTASPSAALPPAASPSSASPPALDDLGSFFGDASASPLAEGEEEPEGVPGLGAVELLSRLDERAPGRGWSCDGPGAGDGDLYVWSCVDPSGAYSVNVLGEGPDAVSSVTAVARGVTDREAEGFFGHVLGLCLRGAPASLSTEAWVSGNVPSGGSTFSGDTGVRIYGSREARALEVTASEL